MAGPQDFMSVPAPNLQQQVPQINFAGALQDFYKSRAENAFAGGIPKDASGNPDFNAMLDRGARAGGVDFLKGVLPYIYMSGSNIQQTNSNTARLLNPGSQQQAAAGGGALGGQTSQRVPTAEAADDAAYIRQAAVARGIDPNVAVRVAASEGLFDYTGDQGSSFGPFQLHYGGIAPGGNAVSGLGDEFTKATGLHASDPRTKKAQIDYALDHAAQNGWEAWHGWKGDKFAGISPQARAAGQSKAAAADIAPQTRPVVAANADSPAGSPAAMGAQPSNAGRAPRASKVDARGNEIVSRSGGVPTRQQASTGSAPEPGTAVPQTVGAGGRSVPAPGRLPAEAPTPQRQPAATQSPAQETVRPALPPIDPVASNPKIQENLQRIGELRAAAVEESKKPQLLGRKSGAEELNAQANMLQQENTSLTAELRKPYEKINEARAQGFLTPQAKEAFDDAAKKATEAGVRQLEAINGAALQGAIELEPHIADGKALLNSGTLYTGYGAETAMEFNRAKQIWGDRQAATPQEAFQKTISAVQLGMANMQKFMGQIGGAQSGASRIFAAQINLIGQASASLGNTVAGNRFLMENAERSVKQLYGIQQLASDYIKAGHPSLDQNFDQAVVDYLRKNPIVKSDLERSDPAKFLSAPQVPKAVAEASKTDPSALSKWQRMVGAKEGQPIRKSDGSGYFQALKLNVPQRAPSMAPEQVPATVGNPTPGVGR